MLGGIILHFFFFNFGKSCLRAAAEKQMLGFNKEWDVGIQREGSWSDLDVEGHENWACALSVAACTKQIPDSTTQSSLEGFCPHERSVMSTL